MSCLESFLDLREAAFAHAELRPLLCGKRQGAPKAGFRIETRGCMQLFQVQLTDNMRLLTTQERSLECDHDSRALQGVARCAVDGNHANRAEHAGSKAIQLLCSSYE